MCCTSPSNQIGQGIDAIRLPLFFNMPKQHNVGKVARHVHPYKFTYKPPYLLKKYHMERIQQDMLVALNRFKEEQDELFKILRMEFNMMYNELLCMDREDSNVIDLTDDIDEDKFVQDCEWIATNLPQHDDDEIQLV